jgi:hypothetical protein
MVVDLHVKILIVLEIQILEITHVHHVKQMIQLHSKLKNMIQMEQ